MKANLENIDSLHDATDPDAELKRLWGVIQRCDSAPPNPDGNDDDLEAINEEWSRAYRRAVSLPVSTMAGLIVKIHMVCHEVEDGTTVYKDELVQTTREAMDRLLPNDEGVRL